MARPQKLDWESALNWVKGIPEQTALEGAPSNGATGRIPRSHFRPINRDLSNLPTEERYVVRPVGDPKGGVIMLLPRRVVGGAHVVTAELTAPGYLTREDALAERERLILARENFAAQRELWIRESREADVLAGQRRLTEIRAMTEMQQFALTSVREARQGQMDLAQTVHLLGQAEAMAVEQNAGAETSRQVGFFLNRMADFGLLWRLKKAKTADGDSAGFDLIMKHLPPDWREDIQGFLLSDYMPEMPKDGKGPKPDGAEFLSAFLSYRSHMRAQPEEPEAEPEDDSQVARAEEPAPKAKAKRKAKK